MQVEVHYLFSKNKKIGSYGIRICTAHLSKIVWKSVPSHVAILINNRWVHESTVDSGVRVLSYKKWLEINEEIHKVKLETKLDYSNIKESFRSIKGKKYDWLGAIYFGLMIIWNLLSKSQIPKQNKWNKKDKYFCSEVIGKVLNMDFSMTAPVQIMEKQLKHINH